VTNSQSDTNNKPAGNPGFPRVDELAQQLAATAARRAIEHVQCGVEPLRKGTSAVALDGSILRDRDCLWLDVTAPSITSDFVQRYLALVRDSVGRTGISVVGEATDEHDRAWVMLVVARKSMQGRLRYLLGDNYVEACGGYSMFDDDGGRGDQDDAL
jgi:hypothetical protein